MTPLARLGNRGFEVWPLRPCSPGPSDDASRFGIRAATLAAARRWSPEARWTSPIHAQLDPSDHACSLTAHWLDRLTPGVCLQRRWRCNAR